MSQVRDDIRTKKDLAKLVKLGLLRKEGEKRGTRYILADR